MKTEIKIPGFGGKVKLKDLAVMSRQFATMINSGLSLLRALTILAEQTENKELARGPRPRSRNDVETGTALSAALAKHPEVFPPLMVNMSRAGEIGGFLDSVLLQIAENYEAEVKLRGKIKSAMTYPVVVFVMAILAVDRHAAVHRPGLRQDVRRPRRRAAGADPGADLPVATCSRSLVPVLVVGSSRSRRLGARSSTTTRVRNVVDPLKLKMPVFGKLFQKIALSRFARNLGTMLRSGVPILQSLDIVGRHHRQRRARAGRHATSRRASAAVSRWPAPLAQPPGLPADGRADDGGR